MERLPKVRGSEIGSGKMDEKTRDQGGDGGDAGGEKGEAAVSIVEKAFHRKTLKYWERVERVLSDAISDYEDGTGMTSESLEIAQKFVRGILKRARTSLGTIEECQYIQIMSEKKG